MKEFGYFDIAHNSDIGNVLWLHDGDELHFFEYKTDQDWMISHAKAFRGLNTNLVASGRIEYATKRVSVVTKESVHKVPKNVKVDLISKFGKKLKFVQMKNGAIWK